MTDEQIEKILTEDKPVAAVLLVRGGWLSDRDEVLVQVAFPSDEKSPTLWRVVLGGSHSVYVEAASIIGVSVRRYDGQLQSERDLEDQTIGPAPGQGLGQSDEGEG